MTTLNNDANNESLHCPTTQTKNCKPLAGKLI
jgi:hypothetical protein